MKKLVFGLVVFIGLIVSLFVLIFLKIFTKKATDEVFIKVFLKNFSQICLKMLRVDIQLVDKNNNSKHEKTLIVANHLSLFDVLVMLTILDENLLFISKKENNNIPIISMWMKTMNTLFLDRSNLKQNIGVINNASRILEKTNKNVVVFPQGTRNNNNVDFKAGTFKIAYKAKANILPITLVGTNKLLKNNFSYRKSVVNVELGNVLYYEDYQDEKMVDLGKRIQGIIFKTKIK